MTQFREFSKEIANYMGLPPGVGVDSNNPVGLGAQGIYSIPEVLNQFGHIRGIVYLQAKLKVDSPKFEEFKRNFAGTPLPITITLNDSPALHMFLPLVNLQAPGQIVTGLPKTFSGAKTIVVYNDAPPTVITLGMNLRNSPMSPWVRAFSALCDILSRSSELEEGAPVKLMVPKYVGSSEATGLVEAMNIRILTFTVGNMAQSGTPAVLTVLPEDPSDFNRIINVIGS